MIRLRGEAPALLLLAALLGCTAGASTPSRSIVDAGSDREGNGNAAPVAGWAEGPPLPFAQQETAVVALAGKVWVLGGLDAAWNTLAAVHVFDPVTGAWSAGPPLPRPLHHVNAAVVSGRIWVTGALSGGGFAPAGDVYAFDPATNAWTTHTPMPAARARGGSLVAAVGATVYVAGGLRGGSVADADTYDTEHDRWTEAAPLPSARDHGVAVAHHGIVYAIGGRDGSLGGHFARVDAFDPRTGTWSPRAPMPTSRGGHAAALVKDRIVVLGGEGDAGNPATGVFAEVEAYDPETDRWTTLPPMPTPRHGMGAATIDSALWVPGGGIRQSLAPTVVVEVLRVP